MFNDKTFHSNFKAFIGSHPHFRWMEKLSLSSLPDFVQESESTLSFKHRKRWITIENIDAQEPILSTSSVYSENVRILGLGSGSSVLSFLKEGNSVSIIEKNPFLILRFLGQYAVSNFLETKILTFEDAFFVFCSSGFSYTHLHPTLYKIYYDLKQTRINTEEFDVLMEGELMIDDWNSTLRQSSTDAYNYPHYMLPTQKIVSDLSHVQCKRIWSVNRVNGLATIASALQKPYLIYEIDPDLSPLSPAEPNATTTSLFTYRPENATKYSESGWKSHFLPLAAPQRMSPQPNQDYSCRLSFVGTSMLENGRFLLSVLNSIAKSSDARLLVEEFKQQQIASPEDFLAEKFHKRWLELGEDEIFSHRGFPALTKKCFYEWSGSVHRIHLVKTASEFGIEVWGDASWSEISKENPGISYKGEAGNLFEVPKIYSNSKVNLDITRNYQLDIYTLRVFDVLACESLVITNTQSPLPVFKNTHPPTFNSAAELTNLLSEIFNWSENEYRDRVRELTLEVNEYHRMKHRLNTMLEISAKR